MSELFEPKIVGFLCNWCSYAGADLAGTSRLSYPPNIRIVRVPCSGRVDPLFVARAFKEGADGVLVLGCHPGDCHYSDGNYVARRRFAVMQELLFFLGFERERVKLDWVSASEGARFGRVVTEFTEVTPDTYEISGDMPVDDFLDEIDYHPADIEEDDYDTMNGLALSVLEHIPAVGETFQLGRLTFTVLEMEEQKIEKMRVILAPDSEK